MRILIAAGALAMAFAGTAYAQNRPANQGPGQPQWNQPNQQPNQPNRPNQSGQHPGQSQHRPQVQPVRQPPRPAPAPARYDPPRHWKGSHANWQTHVQRCQQRYRSYNPRTDRYVPRAGRTAICRL